MKRFACLSFAALAISLGAPGSSAFAQAAPFDAAVEVAALFKATLSDEKPPERCEYAAAWTLDEAGNVPLLLSGPWTPEPAVLPTPRDVLSINQAETHGFCDEEEKRRFLAAKIHDVEQGITPSFAIREMDLTFPVFSQDRTHAIYLKRHAYHTWSMTPDGVKPTRPSIMTRDAILCSKETGTWRVYRTKNVAGFE